jgi:hypothetical protein
MNLTLRKVLSILLKLVGLAVLTILTIPYIIAPIYNFPSPKQFSGSYWINPYSTLDSSMTWRKANFHLHSIAWAGTTDGSTEIHQLDSVYTALEYDVVSLSNYHKTDTLSPRDSLFIPTYEHGYNIQKTHQLSIGAKEVDWFDCILPQTLSVKQYIIQRLRDKSDVVTIAHPSFGRPSYYESDMCYLQGYHCMEVYNHYRTSYNHWDSALTAGIPVWCVGNDDSHNGLDAGETGVCWTMIASANRTRLDITRAMFEGRTIAMKGMHGSVKNGLKSMNVIQHPVADSLLVELTAKADSIEVIGQGGVKQCVYKNQQIICHQLNANDTYIRLKVYTAENAMLLNPIFRSERVRNTERPEVNLTFTWLARILYAIAMMYLMYHSFRNTIKGA